MSDQEKVTSNEGEQQETPEQKSGKILKKFLAIYGQVEAVIGKALPKTDKRKVPKDKMAELIREMFKEEDEALVKEVQTELKGLLKTYVVGQREIEDAKKKLKGLEELKMKEFTEAGEKLLKKIDGIPAIQAEYTDAVKKLAGGSGGTSTP